MCKLKILQRLFHVFQFRKWLNHHKIDSLQHVQHNYQVALLDGMLSLYLHNDEPIIVSIQIKLVLEIGDGQWFNYQEKQNQHILKLVQEKMKHQTIYGQSVHLNFKEVMIEPILQQYFHNLDYEIHEVLEVWNHGILQTIIHTCISD